MAKTNKEFRSDLAKEMRDKLKERNEKLEQVEKSSLSEWIKEQKRKEIMDNFEKQIDEIENRPQYVEAKKTHLNQIKAKIKFNKAKKEYEDAQISHSWAIEVENLSQGLKWFENVEPPKKLRYYREEWKEKCKSFRSDKNAQDKIMQASENISVKVNVDNDGGRLITLQLKNKTYKILDPGLGKIQKYNEYLLSKNELSGDKKYDEQLIRMCGDVDEWADWDVKKYVKQKQIEWFHIPSKKEINGLLSELWDIANINSEDDQIVMLMYLTGLYWDYLLDDYDYKAEKSCILICSSQVQKIRKEETKWNPFVHARPLMILNG